MENRYVKARVRATGEIVEVYRPIYESKLYRKDDPLMSYDYKELEFLNDGIDWEQRRFELVKAITQGFASDHQYLEQCAERVLKYSEKGIGYNMYDCFAEGIVHYADAVLAEYKKGGEK